MWKDENKGWMGAECSFPSNFAHNDGIMILKLIHLPDNVSVNEIFSRQRYNVKWRGWHCNRKVDSIHEQQRNRGEMTKKRCTANSV